MSIYDEMQAVTRELFDDPIFKQGVIAYVQLQSVAGGTPDEPAANVEVTTVLSATAEPVSTKYVDGSHIFRSDVQVTAAAGTVTPSMSGYLTIDGVRYKIIEIMRIPAAGTPVVYVFIVRR